MSVTSKKPLDIFFKNFQITGAAPTTILKQTTKETAINNAYKFLNKSMLIPVGGSRFPNKLNWKRAAESLNQYNLTNAQKNLIRRVNIAIAAQPVKGLIEKRLDVKIPLTGNRNKNVTAQAAAVKRSKNSSTWISEQTTRRKGGSSNPVWKPVVNIQTARQHREAFGN